MGNISIVILNYLNYKDTIECIESIFKMRYDLDGIVIVDNDSQNESYSVLKKRYKRTKNIIIVKANSNYGFAKGNNIGIKIARQRFGSEFIFVVNNDTIFVQEKYFKNLLNKYRPGVGIIGSEIHLKNNTTQEEVSHDISLRGSLNTLFCKYLAKYDKRIWSFLLPKVSKRYMVNVLHGCALLFTPDFFKYYSGFYDRTFLYSEEPILYLMCKRRGLKQIYDDSTYIFHKEDQSSEMSFQNNLKVRYSYQCQSYKYLVWWIMKDKISDMFKRILSDKSKY